MRYGGSIVAGSPMKANLAYVDSAAGEACDLCDRTDRLVRIRRSGSRSTPTVDLRICPACLLAVDEFERREWKNRQPPADYIDGAGTIDGRGEATQCNRCRAIVSRGHYASPAEIAAHERSCPNPRRRGDADGG